MKARLCTTDEAARRLGVSRRRVQQYCRSGALPATMAGRDWIITEADLARFSPKPPYRPKKIVSDGEGRSG